jgi:hypothetical protein
MPEKLVPYSARQYRQLITLLELAEATREMPHDLCVGRRSLVRLDDSDSSSIQDAFDTVLGNREDCLIFREQSGDALGELLCGDQNAYANFDNKSVAALTLFMQEWIALSIEKFRQASLNCQTVLQDLGGTITERTN